MTTFKLAAACLVGFSLSACADASVVWPDRTEPAAESLGLVEVTISGLGGPGDPSARVLSAATVDELRRLRAARARAESVGEYDLTLNAFTPPDNSAATGDGTIQLDALSTGSFTHGERGSGGVRRFWAVFRVRNAQTDGAAYDTPRQNLTFVAVTDGTTVGANTPISGLEVYDGSAAASSIADAIVPTGAATLDSDGVVASAYPDVLQVFSEAEAGGVAVAGGVTDVFPYGFVVRRAGATHTRTLPASPATGEYDGVVTFAFEMPLQATAADDPFTVSALFIAYDDDATRMTQAVEEQSGRAVHAFAERSTALGTSSVSLLPDATYLGTATGNVPCRVRATGTSGSPTAYVAEAATTEPWLVSDPFAVTPDGPAFLPATAPIRAGRCGAAWSTPGATNFPVHGAQTGALTGGAYAGGGAEGLIESPGGDFFPGEVVEATLTTGLGIAAPIVARYRVASEGGSGAFAAPVTYGASHLPESVAAGDFDGDGDLDLATANSFSNDVAVLLGDGDGTFAAAVTYGAGDGPRSVVAGDFDGDGDLDLVTANAGSNNVSVLLGDGDGTFAADVTYGAGNSPRSVAAGDFDGDGDLDLATANYLGDNISVLRGLGDGTFAARVTYGAGNNPRSVTAGDFDGDGDLDLATANRGSDHVSVLLGDGDGTFADDVIYGAGDGPVSVTAGDFDGDGDLDLAAANAFSNRISVLLGNGDGTFADDVTYAAGNGPQSVTAGDFDGDGDLDLATATAGSGSNDVVSVLLGKGDGTFAARVTFGAGTNGLVFATAGDFDGDGDLDLATANFTDNNVSVLRNR